MKKIFTLLASIVLSVSTMTAYGAWNQDEADELHEKAQIELAKLEGADSYFSKAVAYVIIPTVGKAGFGIGGARGKGILYEGGVPTAVITLTQLSFGFQFGGQAYTEYLFFEDNATLQNFKKGNYELGAQATAVAWKSGVAVNAEFNGGMAILTVEKGGLMYEASVGGQKFKVEEK